MPTRQTTLTGMVRKHGAGVVSAGPREPFARQPPRLPWHARLRLLLVSVSAAAGSLLPGSALVAALAGCATLTESTEQYVMVQTVLDHQQVAGIGCVLSNDIGRWFVTSPGRVRVRKSTQPLTVDCRLNDVYVYDQISPKQNSSRWGNILLTAGTGQFVDRQTGAGFDYPSTLTVLLKRVAPPPPAPPAAPPPKPKPEPKPDPKPPAPPPQPPQPPGGSTIY
ncbi:hypothetical protein [Pseudoduganella lutea]|uniref:hypothetical protein n=1 Tax=Pseudoduganella lutea TaxID=321985 RepID=UPI001A9210FA|nr:hypothetical protein [Pseudoduganella lutea]